MEQKKLIKIGGIIFVVFLIILFIAVFIMYSDPQMVPGGKLALVEINGPIYSSQDLIDQIHRHNEDRYIKAIVLRIDSPGGAVAPVQEIHRELNKVDKKVVVSMGATAASGGYYIASAADWIFANPGTVTGSIGVIMQFPKLEELMKKIGISEEIIKSGKYKDAGSLYRSFTPEERVLFQGVVEDVHSQFIDAIVEGRKNKELNRGQVAEMADGRILSGRQAMEKKLVDELGNLDDAIEYTGKLVGITGRPKIVNLKPRKSLLERLITGSLGSDLEKILHNQALIRYELTGI